MHQMFWAERVSNIHSKSLWMLELTGQSCHTAASSISFCNIGFTESYGYFYAICFHQTQMMCKFQVTSTGQDQLNSGWI